MIEITRKLFSAVGEHKQAAERFDQKTRFWTSDQVSSSVPKLNVVKYFQRNIFSIIFLAVYDGLRIPRNRRVLYGLVNRCIRGVVTGADNILDHEYNPIFTFHAWDYAPDRYKSLITALLSQLILDDVLRDGEDAGLFGRRQTKEIKLKLSENLGAIGIQDAGGCGPPFEDFAQQGNASPQGHWTGNVVAGVLSGPSHPERSTTPERKTSHSETTRAIAPPNEVKEKVHELKGGALLSLAMHAPMVIEPSTHGGVPEKRLARAQKALHNIGMGLQMLDDVVDFYEDVAWWKPNYLVSHIYHFGSAGEKERLISILPRDSIDSGESSAQLALKTQPLETHYEESLTEVIGQSTSPVLAGFRLLEEEGFFMGEKEARKFLKMLFVARGAGRLCKLAKT